MPVILMSEGSCSSTGDVLRAVKLGAVDWLDKPLFVLKLKNIWQHSVRRMMQRSGSEDKLAAGCRCGTAGAGAGAGGSKRSSGLESPATPTAAEETDAISTASFGSMRDLGGAPDPSPFTAQEVRAGLGGRGWGSCLAALRWPCQPYLGRGRRAAECSPGSC